jgi:endonuclease III
MPRESLKNKRIRSASLLTRLGELYPDAVCSLTFTTPYELWVATVLSAQCTDARVNQVTPPLFAAAPDVTALAALPLPKLEELIHSTGFFRNKAKNLNSAAQVIIRDHGGVLPATMPALVALPGIGRKTANVILGNAFGEPGLPVDTHVGRLARRLGLTTADDPVKVEQDLGKLFPPESWTMLGHQLIAHGRATCSSRKADCQSCGLADHCPRKGVDK